MKKKFSALCILFINFYSIGQGKPDRIPNGYSVQTIDTPKEVSFGVGGMEFAPNGDLYVCTREGDVWQYKTSKKEWSLFADGLHEALGIWIDSKSREVFVIQRGEISQLIDSDKDGNADFYKTINADWGVTDNYHEYALSILYSKFLKSQ